MSDMFSSLISSLVQGSSEPRNPTVKTSDTDGTPRKRNCFRGLRPATKAIRKILLTCIYEAGPEGIKRSDLRANLNWSYGYFNQHLVGSLKCNHINRPEAIRPWSDPVYTLTPEGIAFLESMWVEEMAEQSEEASVES